MPKDLKDLRVTGPVLKVFGLLLGDRDGEHYGLSISKSTRIASGTLYPVLIRLEKLGLIAGEWEQIDPVAANRPPRRFYRLTGSGVTYAREILREYSNVSSAGLTYV